MRSGSGKNHQIYDYPTYVYIFFIIKGIVSRKFAMLLLVPL
jgi:hypothetical protein